MNVALGCLDQTPQHDRLATKSADGGDCPSIVDYWGVQNLPAGRESNGYARLRGNPRLLSAYLHHDQSVRADPRNDIQNQADLTVRDNIGLGADDRLCDAAHGRHVLTDDD